MAFAVSMGSFINGFSAGYTSPALPSMNETLVITDEEVKLNNNLYRLYNIFINVIFMYKHLLYNPFIYYRIAGLEA